MSYTYAATVVRVIDGDTIVMDVDLGFGVWMRGQSFRLLGLNAREHTDPGGQAATANLRTLLSTGAMVSLTSIKNDKFGGRYDAVVTNPGGNLNQLLIQQQWAAAWDGVGTKPVPPWPRPLS